MALNLPGIKNIFSHSKTVDTGLGKERIGAATFIVSPDGTGDFDSIQEALDALGSKTNVGGEIFIKPGIYKIKSTLTPRTNKVSIKGSGIATIIEDVSAAGITMITISLATSIKDLALKGKNVVGSIGISGGGGVNICENLEITFCKGGAIVLASADDSIINNCHIVNCLNGIVLDNNCDRVKIRGNFIVGNTGTGIIIGTGQDNLVMGNIVFGNTTAQITDNGTDTLPNGTRGTNNLALDDLNIIA